MAKSLRSSRKKVNKSKLRSNVFGPVENARKERLSTKLLELATNPQSRTEDGSRTMDEAKGRHYVAAGINDQQVLLTL